MEAVRAPPVEAGLPARSPVTPARGAGGDVDVPRRDRVTHEESGRAIPPADALLFRQVVLPHLDAAYNLARWLTRDPDDARDAVQEAALRAFRSLASLQGRGRAAVVPHDRPRRRARVRERERQAEVDPLRRARREGGEPFVEALASPARTPRRCCSGSKTGVIDGLLRTPAARVPRGAGATRAGGAVLQGDRRGGRDPGRDRDVTAGARAAAAAGLGAGTRAGGVRP